MVYLVVNHKVDTVPGNCEMANTTCGFMALNMQVTAH